MMVWRRGAILLTLILLAQAGAERARAQDDDLVKARALEKALARIIEQNESAIACILVSRSEGYQAFGQGPDKDRPGKLGTFRGGALRDNEQFLKLTAKKQEQWEKLLDFAAVGYVPRAFGSGVVVDADGLILTNYHVIQDATKIFVRLPGGKSSYADIHAADPRSDLAVLKLLNGNMLPLKAITLGDADKLQRGHFVLTLANPFAASFRDGQPSASWGIISNIRRRVAAQLKKEDRPWPFQHYGTLLQIDARLSIGCSGGALLNLSGEMVGLTTSTAAIQGGETPGGFAIPINPTVRSIVDVLKRGEEVEYGWLGIAPEEREPNGKPGVVLSNIGAGSPAAVDGKLKKGDLLLAVNGHTIHESDDIFVAIGMHLAGSKVKLHVRRQGKEDAFPEVTLAKLNVPGKRIVSSLGKRPYLRGLRVDYSSLIAQEPFRRVTIPEGVFVSEVVPESSADRATLKLGDIITHVNGIRVSSPPAFYQATKDAQGPIELTLYNDPPTFVTLK